jgi:RimJ/RimL family protein N-acetyltransferase
MMIAVPMCARDAVVGAGDVAPTAGCGEAVTMGEQATYELHTPRLRLRALSLSEARLAMGRQRAALGRQVGARISSAWPGPELINSLPTIIAEMVRQTGDERWLWLIIEQATERQVGDIGFHGPVVGAATVELGWQVAPASRGRGFATEAAVALLRWAAARPGVERVVVRIEPANSPSLRVAAKLGMREITSAEPNYRRFEWVVDGASSEEAD